MLNELEQKIRKAIPELSEVIDGYVCSKPIQLNHALEYLKINGKTYGYILTIWNLKSNLLSDQSIELIKFINEL